MAVRGAGEYCTYCKRELVAYTSTHPTRDHVVPKSKGGKRTVWCCTKCNNAKGNMLPEEWAEFMQRFPNWWAQPGAEARARKQWQIIVGNRRPQTRSDTAYILRYGKKAWKRTVQYEDLIAPKVLPDVTTDPACIDPKLQIAFANVYGNRLHLLRVPKEQSP